MAEFTKKLVISPLDNGYDWEVKQPFQYITDIGLPWGHEINVPVGFITDGASVPRILWAIIPRWGRYSKAVVIHDYLYRETNIERKIADKIMKEAMIVCKTKIWRQVVMYWAVRLFGKRK